MLALLLLTVASPFQDGFATNMALFEQAKAKGDFATCERALTEALRFSSDEYAVGSLVWSQMNQNKTEAALANARKMVDRFGNTPYAIGSLIDASLREGDFDTSKKAALIAVANHLGDGDGWQRAMVRELISKVDGLNRPAVYRLRWTIPVSEFAGGNQTRLFGFPILKDKWQTFTYTLAGASSSKVLESSVKRTVVEIAALPGRDVEVEGTATIQAQAIGARTLRSLASIPLEVDAKDTGKFYYWTEEFDPKTPSIAGIAHAVRRASAAGTVQAVLDWRDAEMPYRELQPGPGSTLDRIVAQKCGVCHDASYMTASLLRANGIPATVIGVDCLPADGEFKDAVTSHGHIAVKLPRLGWVNVEPLRRDSLTWFGGTNYLRFAIESERDVQNRTSLQAYPVSGRKLP